MRVFPSMSMLSACLATTLAVSSPVNASMNPHVVYGLANAQHFTAHSKGPFYVQAATFKSIDRAKQYKKQLINKFHHPVSVKTKGNYHIVVIGPINSVDEVRALGGSKLTAVSTIKTPVHHEPKVNNVTGNYRLDKDGLMEPIIMPNRHFEVIGALGVARLDTDNSRLAVSSSETDLLVQNHHNNWDDWDILVGQLGVGYNYYFGNAQRYSDLVQWFPSLAPQLNLYYLNNNSAITGQVWRFEDPNFNQLTYRMSVRSLRLMLDGALTILSKNQFSLYAKGGIGNAWNRINYSDRDIESVGSCSNEQLRLNSNTDSNFAWEAGGGLIYAFNERVALSLEYLYADLGKVRLSSSRNLGTTETSITSSSFNLNAHQALIGIHVAL